MSNEKTFQFKTNINCSGCVATVKPFLDKTAGADQWNVETNNPNKVLTVQSTNATEEQVVAAVKQAGYKIESINQ